MFLISMDDYRRLHVIHSKMSFKASLSPREDSTLQPVTSLDPISSHIDMTVTTGARKLNYQFFMTYHDSVM